MYDLSKFPMKPPAGKTDFLFNKSICVSVIQWNFLTTKGRTHAFQDVELSKHWWYNKDGAFKELSLVRETNNVFSYS